MKSVSCHHNINVEVLLQNAEERVDFFTRPASQKFFNMLQDVHNPQVLELLTSYLNFCLNSNSVKKILPIQGLKSVVSYHVHHKAAIDMSLLNACICCLVHLPSTLRTELCTLMADQGTRMTDIFDSFVLLLQQNAANELVMAWLAATDIFHKQRIVLESILCVDAAVHVLIMQRVDVNVSAVNTYLQALRAILESATSHNCSLFVLWKDIWLLLDSLAELTPSKTPSVLCKRTTIALIAHGCLELTSIVFRPDIRPGQAQAKPQLQGHTFRFSALTDTTSGVDELSPSKVNMCLIRNYCCIILQQCEIDSSSVSAERSRQIAIYGLQTVLGKVF